jgi:hypothetical protein
LTGKAEIGYGNYRTFTGGAFLAGPLSQTLSFSLSGQYENRDKGFGRNIVTGHDIQTSESYAARGKLCGSRRLKHRFWSPLTRTGAMRPIRPLPTSGSTRWARMSRR